MQSGAARIYHPGLHPGYHGTSGNTATLGLAGGLWYRLPMPTQGSSMPLASVPPTNSAHARAPRNGGVPC